MRAFFLTLGLLSLAVALAACGPRDGKARNNCIGPCREPLTSAEAAAPFEGAAAQDWTTFRADPLRTGWGEGATVGDQVEEAWSVPDFMVRDWTAVKPSAAVWEDTLYVPSDDGTMYAFDRFDGSERWSTKLINRSPGIHSSPQVTKSTVLVGTYAGDLHCLDRETGEKIWRYRIGNVIGSSPVYVPEDNAIYVSHETPKTDELPGGGYVTKNDPRNGKPVWVSEKLEHWPHSSVAVDASSQVVVVGANDGVVRGYDTGDGSTLWTRDFETDFDGEADVKTTPAIDPESGVAVVGTWDDNVYALDLEDGEIRWSFTTGGNVHGSAALDVENRRVYQGSRGAGDTFFAIDLDTGEEVWGADLGDISSSPALSDDRARVVVGTSDGRVVALEADTGEVVWEFEADGAVTASPTLVDDFVYVAARFGSLYALKTK
jgi:outer membrane protein assembly factor BamB